MNADEKNKVFNYIGEEVAEAKMLENLSSSRETNPYFYCDEDFEASSESEEIHEKLERQDAMFSNPYDSLTGAGCHLWDVRQLVLPKPGVFWEKKK